MACLRLVTLSPELDRNVPRLRRRMALSTVSLAFFEYRVRVAGMSTSVRAKRAGVRLTDTHVEFARWAEPQD